MVGVAQQRAIVDEEAIEPAETETTVSATDEERGAVAEPEARLLAVAQPDGGEGHDDDAPELDDAEAAAAPQEADEQPADDGDDEQTASDAEIDAAADAEDAEQQAAAADAVEAEEEADADAETEAALAAEAEGAGDAETEDEAATGEPAAVAQGAEGNDGAEEAEEDAEGPEARPEELRLLEALLFAASEPLDEKILAARLPEGVDVHGALRRLQAEFGPRGVNLVRIAGKWTFRTANDLAWLLAPDAVEPKKLSRAALETLAIIAYHQPVTRAEIEEIRGVSTSKGTLDVLLETGWVRLRGRRKTPGRPVTFGTTEAFLSHFGLENLSDLPGLEELKGSGLLEGSLPPGFSVPVPNDEPGLREDEEPLEEEDLDLALAPAVSQEPEPESEPDPDPEQE